MKLLVELLPFGFLGAFIGQGPYSLLNWEWWGMLVTLVTLFTIRDVTRMRK